jgi:immune inhibitor A
MTQRRIIAFITLLVLLNTAGFLTLRQPKTETPIPTLDALATSQPLEVLNSVERQPTQIEVVSNPEKDADTVAPETSNTAVEPVENITIVATPDTPPATTLIQPVANSIVLRFREGASQAERDALIASVGGVVESEITALNAVVIQVIEPLAATAVLENSPIIASSEPDYIVTALQEVYNPPNDEFFTQQWALTAIEATQSWTVLPENAPTVTIAVIDSGVCYDHPDLSGRILATGYDFVEGDTVAQDEAAHGCAVAGIIAANMNNTIGIVGVAPNAQILPLRVLDANAAGRYSDVASAIIYAVDNGAQIINLSLGGSNPSSVLADAVNYAAAHNVIMVAAVGNSGGNAPMYPAAYESVIAVGAYDANYAVSSFNNQGYDVVAPGVNILTTHINNGYQPKTGTSFAAPHIAAQKALELAGVTIETVVLPPQPPVVTTVVPPMPVEERAPLRIMVPPDAEDRDVQSLAARFPNLDIARSFSFGPRMDAVTGQLAGTFNLLTILVRFSDKANSITATSFNSFIYGTTRPSVRHYYDEVSYGNLDIVTVNMPSSLGWRIAPNSYAYYVDGQYCFGSYPNNCQKLAEDLALAVDPLVNFANYDNDNDGYVDAIFIVHAGTGAEWSGNVNDIWSHQFSTFNEPIVDGKRVSTYVTAPEYWQTPGDITIGVYVHELGHAFGLPDFYDVQADEFDFTSSGIGEWSLMSGGSWNWNLDFPGDSPAHPDPYSRTYLGWTTPTNLTGASQSLTILPVETNSNQVYRLNNPYNPDEYFLLENRQWLGYDDALYWLDFSAAAKGMLIWHIDEALVNNSNSTECTSVNNWLCGNNHFGIALEQADGWRDLEFGFSADAGDPFPGSSGRTTFNFTTNPNTSSYYSTLNPGISLSGIGMSGNNINLNLNGSPPPHDDFDNAKVISELAYTDTLFTALATQAGDDPVSSCDSSPVDTVWYRYTALQDENVTFDTIGSNYNTVLSVWTGNRGFLTAVACNNDYSSTQSLVSLSLTENVTYYIKIAGYNGATGRLVFNAKVEPPPNDLFANALVISALPYTDTKDTRGATSTGESQPCGDLGLGIWYAYTPSIDQTVTFDTLGSDYDTAMALYSGSMANLVACNDDEDFEGGIYTSKITANLTGGITYYILAGGWNGDNGELVFNAVIVPSDLVFTSFDAEPDHTLAGQTNLNFTISNLGSGIAGATTAQIILSDDATIGNGDDVAVTTANIPSIIAGGEYIGTVTVDLPVNTLFAHADTEDPTGQPLGTDSTSVDTVAMLLDSTDVVAELDENNNEATDDITYFGWDTNRDTVVSPVDAIYVINRLLPGTDMLADIDGNTQIQEADVNVIINRFGYQRNTGVDEIAPTPPPAPPTGSNVNLRYEIITTAPSMYLMQPSDTFTMNIYAEDIRSTPQSVYSAYLDVTYNPTVLTLTGGVTYGANFAGNPLLLESVSVGSITDLGATSANLIASSDTLLATLQFQVNTFGNSELWMSPASISDFADITIYGNDNEQVNSTQFTNVSLWIRQLPTATPLPTDTPIPTNTAEPNPQTVGLFSGGIWTFRDSNTTGLADIRFQFGTAEAGWIPIVGDWDGDDVDGIGLYRNGTFILRDNSSAGPIEYIVTLGIAESGWQPVAGDWNGDGIDSVGLYKNGLWLLTNANQRNAPIAHRITFNPFGILASMPIAGDWSDSAHDGIGLYYNGSFSLLNNLTGAPLVTNFSFGPRESGWKPLAGDWDGDGRDTIGIYKDGLWRLRNSNSTGTPDIGFTFRGNGLPVANYRGGIVGLLALAESLSIPVETLASPTAIFIVEQTPEVTEPFEATMEVTIEVTVEVQPTEEPTATLVIPTETPTETATSLPTETPVPTEPPTSEPPPETTEETSP